MSNPSGPADARVFSITVLLFAALAAVGCSAEGSHGGSAGGIPVAGGEEGAAGSSGSQPMAGDGAGMGAEAGTVAGAGGSGEPPAAGNPGRAGEGPAGTGGSGGDSCAGLQERAEARLLPSDVIWAIDTSGSMTASFPSIQQALNDFSARVIAAGVDARIILLAGSGLCVPVPLGSGQCGPSTGVVGAPALDTREPEFLHLDIPFGWSQGMSVILDNHGLYQHLLRPDSHVQFVLTEDGPPPMLAADVTDRIEGRGLNPWDPPLAPGSWTFNGIVCVNGIGVSTCLISMAVPTTTLELIQNTSGIVADLDLAGQAGADPFAELLDKLATAVIVGASISCEYTIPPAPPGETFDRERVNVVYTNGQGVQVTYPMVPAHVGCGANQGWKYDDEAQPSKVVLCPAACEVVQQDLEAQISVEFGCETLVLLE